MEPLQKDIDEPYEEVMLLAGVLKEAERRAEEAKDAVVMARAKYRCAMLRAAALSGEEILALISKTFHERHLEHPPAAADFNRKAAYQFAEISARCKGDWIKAVSDRMPLFDGERDRNVALLRRLLDEFDLDDFIMTHTHYDECTDGRFWRRS